jgi:predicted nucleic acid-binding protein
LFRLAIANDLLKSGWDQANAVISTQVLQEYFSAATRKLGVPVEIARRKIELLDRLVIVSIVHEDVLHAIDLHRLHAFLFRDALIVGMAQKSACRILFTGDMQPLTL